MCFKINIVKAIRKDKGINLGAIPKDLKHNIEDIF